MKKLLLFFTISVFGVTLLHAQDSYDNVSKEDFAVETTNSLNWIKSYEKAVKIAKKQHKPLLIFFTGSDWCRPCQLLTEDFFDSDKFKKIADKSLVLYEADVPRRTDVISPELKAKNKALGKKFGVSSYPTLIAVNSNGRVIDMIKGYNFMFRDTDQHFKFINSILNN